MSRHLVHEALGAGERRTCKQLNLVRAVVSFSAIAMYWASGSNPT